MLNNRYCSLSEQRSIAMGKQTVCDMLTSFSFYPDVGHWMLFLNLWSLFLTTVARTRPNCPWQRRPVWRGSSGHSAPCWDGASSRFTQGSARASTGRVAELPLLSVCDAYCFSSGPACQSHLPIEAVDFGWFSVASPACSPFL